MEIINSITELARTLNGYRAEGKHVGLVPTMGALHEGHISLVKRCRQENNITVVSLFVNPTQFNDKKDLLAYPRTVKEDADILSENMCDILFIPSVDEIYPTEQCCNYDFGNLANVMEGVSRVGHFDGVWQIVSKLFDIVEPSRAYFGEKDYQQLAIICKMTNDCGYKIEIIGCETYRTESGLALSSRNMLLSAELRELASEIYKTINEASQIKWGNSLEAEKYVKNRLNTIEPFEVEYFTIADEITLQEIVEWDSCSTRRGFIVVKVGNVRLIDNIKFL